MCGLFFCFQPLMRLNSYSTAKTAIPKYVLDCGKCSAHFICSDTDESGFMPHEGILNLQLPRLMPGDTIVIEEAHLRSRESNSLAQPFTYDQLSQLKARADGLFVTIKVFPQKVTPKARTLANLTEKNDINDVTAILEYLKSNPNALSTLKTFTPVKVEDYRNRNEAKWKDRQELSEDVNAARNLGYEGDEVSAWISNNIQDLYTKLDDELRELLDMRVVSKGRKNERIDYSVNRLYSVVATLMRPDGTLRLRSDVQKLPYWKYAKDAYFAMTPYHMRGGVVASNIKYHWRRASSDFRKCSKTQPLLIEELDEFQAARSAFDKKLRRLWNILRQEVLNANTKIQNKPSQKEI